MPRYTLIVKIYKNRCKIRARIIRLKYRKIQADEVFKAMTPWQKNGRYPAFDLF